MAALLTFDIAIHFYHLHHIPTAVVALLELIALLYFRDEFYAEGDQRNRWRAWEAFIGLVVADIVIGLTYILLARGLRQDYSLSTRVWEVLTGLVGISGPVQWVPEARGDLFNILTSALGLFTSRIPSAVISKTPTSVALPKRFFCVRSARKAPGPARPGRRDPGTGTAGQVR